MNRPRTETFLCHANARNRASCAAAEEFAGRLQTEGFDVISRLEDFSEERVRLILIFGGDGFLMECLRELGYPATPVFGVNFGTVGFLMNPRECLADLLPLVKDHDFREEEHAVLEARVVVESGKKIIVRALNDLVIERMSGQSIRLQVYIDGVQLNRYSGDGLILSTAAGSTAYNLAARGPVLHPRLQGMILTPLYPHRAAPFHSLQFSLLVPLECELRIEVDDLPKRGLRLLADGRQVDRVASIRVSDSGHRVHLLRTHDHVFFKTLSRKFIGEVGDGK